MLPAARCWLVSPMGCVGPRARSMDPDSACACRCRIHVGAARLDSLPQFASFRAWIRCSSQRVGLVGPPGRGDLDTVRFRTFFGPGKPTGWSAFLTSRSADLRWKQHRSLGLRAAVSPASLSFGKQIRLPPTLDPVREIRSRQGVVLQHFIIAPRVGRDNVRGCRRLGPCLQRYLDVQHGAPGVVQPHSFTTLRFTRALSGPPARRRSRFEHIGDSADSGLRWMQCREPRLDREHSKLWRR